jgi:hypothetical protein
MAHQHSPTPPADPEPDRTLTSSKVESKTVPPDSSNSAAAGTTPPPAHGPNKVPSTRHSTPPTPTDTSTQATTPLVMLTRLVRMSTRSETWSRVFLVLRSELQSGAPSAPRQGLRLLVRDASQVHSLAVQSEGPLAALGRVS